MNREKFQLQQYSIDAIIGKIQANDFVIPEIQRPFVWKKVQVRDLIDSLYRGYPTGYIITWKNPDIKTKDGELSRGRNILIDGQQRITALMTALARVEVMDSDFNKIRIKIAYNPIEHKLEVQDASHLKDKRWIPDISELFVPSFDSYTFISKYVESNPEVNPSDVSQSITQIQEIRNRQIGVIELDNSLDIEEVNSIFTRINSKGAQLSQSDFVMSKMAADEKHGGNILRKVIDYFCHLAVKPEFYEILKKDKAFQKSDYANEIKWIAKKHQDIYVPGYGDIIRVAFMYSFGRAKLSDLVSLLSGRDFETREFKEEIIEDSYQKLEKGIRNFINENNFHQFILAIRGAGFISSKIIRSRTVLNFAYMLYLKLIDDPKIPKAQVKHYVQKWYVLSVLTGRYSGANESVLGRDIRSINEKGFLKFLEEAESSVLSNNFWNVTLPQNLEASITTNIAFNVFLAAQIRNQSNSLFMNGLSIADLVTVSGDVHHIFPKGYLMKNGIKNQGRYNQIANYTYLDPQINKVISDDAPNVYFGKIKDQIKRDNMTHIIGNIKSLNELKKNLSENAIPADIDSMTVADYDEFLQERRKLMAHLIRDYYRSL